MEDHSYHHRRSCAFSSSNHDCRRGLRIFRLLKLIPLPVPLTILLSVFLLTGCSSSNSRAGCDQITSFKASLTEKADQYWEEDHPSNGGNADYSRSEALIIEADQLVVDNPSCFSGEEVSLASGRLGVDNQETGPSDTQESSGNSIFEQPAQSYLLASGINSLLAVWGIPLSDQSGPRSLGDVSDDILIYLNSNAAGSGDITKNDLLTSLQPGNALNSIVYQLFTSQEVIDAVVDRWLSYLS